MGGRGASGRSEGCERGKGTTDARTQSTHFGHLFAAGRPGAPLRGTYPLGSCLVRRGAVAAPDGGTCRRTWACACQAQIAWAAGAWDGGMGSRAYPRDGWPAGGFGAARPGCGCAMEYRASARYFAPSRARGGYVVLARRGRLNRRGGHCDQPGVWSICASAARLQLSLSVGRPRALASNCAARRPTAEIRPSAEGQSGGRGIKGIVGMAVALRGRWPAHPRPRDALVGWPGDAEVICSD